MGKVGRTPPSARDPLVALLVSPSASGRGKVRTMSRIRVDDLHRDWMKDPEYRQEYEALEEEFSLASVLIDARKRTGMPQEQTRRDSE
jgi:hypothetical protein